MNQHFSVRDRLLEILIGLPPDERKLLIEEIKEVVRIVSSGQKNVEQLPPPHLQSDHRPPPNSEKQI